MFGMVVTPEIYSPGNIYAPAMLGKQPSCCRWIYMSNGTYQYVCSPYICGGGGERPGQEIALRGLMNAAAPPPPPVTDIKGFAKQNAIGLIALAVSIYAVAKKK